MRPYFCTSVQDFPSVFGELLVCLAHPFIPTAVSRHTSKTKGVGLGGNRKNGGELVVGVMEVGVEGEGG